MSSILSNSIYVKPHRYIEEFLYYEGKPVSFDEWPHSREIIDLEGRSILIMGGRQIAKSISLGWLMFVEIPKAYNIILYIAPSVPQSRVFSNDRIKARINESPLFKSVFTRKDLLANVSEKEFSTNTKIYFRAASQLDNIRGISGKKLVFDEIQDISRDVIVIVKEVAASKEDVRELYAGTAKSLNNYSTTLWESSSKICPVIQCKECKHHNVPYLQNISAKGLICESCKALMYIESDNLKFIALGDTTAETIGFWVPQIALPLHVNKPAMWDRLYTKFKTYNQVQFLNEVLGLPAGSGLQTFTEDDLRKCCQPSFKMLKDFTELPRGITKLYAGLDWGIRNDDKGSYTVLIIGGMDYMTGRFTVVYFKKYMETDHNWILKDIIRTCKLFGISAYIPDYGAGHQQNSILRTTDIPVYPVQYTNENKRITSDANKYHVSKTITLTDLSSQIKYGRIHFPEWEAFQEIAPHFLAEYAELRKDRFGNERYFYDHNDGCPDDALQATNILFAVLRDIIDPSGIYFGVI